MSSSRNWLCDGRVSGECALSNFENKCRWQVKSAAMERATGRLDLCHFSLTYFVRGANNLELSTCHFSGSMPANQMPWNYVQCRSINKLRRLHVLLLLDLQSYQWSEACLTYTSKREQRIQHWKNKGRQYLDAPTVPMSATVASQLRRPSGQRCQDPYIVESNGTQRYIS